MKALILFILLFFFVRFLIRYIWPVVRVFRNARRGFQQMQQGFNGQQQQPYQAPAQPTHVSGGRNAKKEGDYIDYEEVK